MKMIIISYLFLLLHTTIYAQSNDYYVGAVVEYAPKYDPNESAGANIGFNIDEYEKFIKEAKEKKADIIVFPECGLTTTKYEQNILPYTTIIPDPRENIVPCNNSGPWTGFIQRLSCIAKQNSIYVVVNLPERFVKEANNITFYNTNIVFDRSGTLIARYRKFNLFFEPRFNTTEKPDLTYFETDFNVTFGTFICFDILFTKPSLELLKANDKITDIVYPTAWFSELPFLTAVQTQVGWARANGVNFLAAGYSDPEHASGGSGIYQANGDYVYNIPVEKKSTLIVQKIKKIKHRQINNNRVVGVFKNNISDSNLKLVTLKENMKQYTTVLLNETVENYELCHLDICCTFNIKFTSQKTVDYFYRMIAYSGPRKFSISSHKIQICGLAACKNQSKESCGERISSTSNPLNFDEISIKGNFIDEGNSVIFPSTVLYNLSVLEPTDYKFNTKTDDRYSSIDMKTNVSVSNILGFGVFSVFTDSPTTSKSLSGAIIAIIVIVVLIVVALIGFFVWRRLRNSSYQHPLTN